MKRIKMREPITLLCISNSMNPIGRGEHDDNRYNGSSPLNDILCILGYIIILIFEIKYKKTFS